MSTLFRLLILALAGFAVSVHAAPAPHSLLDSLSRAAPKLNRKVLDSALAAMQCAINNGSAPELPSA